MMSSEKRLAADRIARICLASLVGVGLLGVAADGNPLGSLAALIMWLVSAEAIGIVSSLALAVIRKIWPSINEDYAWIAAILFAAVASAIARLAIPWIPQIPTWVNTLWPVIVLLGQQLWFYVTRPATAFRGLYTQT